MHRRYMIVFALAAGACARQQICKPWSPTTGAAATAEAAAVDATPAAAPDDGTRALAGGGDDDAWTSVVGEAPATRADATVAAPAHGSHRRRTAAAPAKPAATKPAAAAATKPAAAPAPAAAAPAAPAPNPKLAEARTFFAGRCVPCHGEAGRGDGPAGGALNPHPRNFTDRSWQRSVTDAHIEQVILKGGAANGLSPLMPPHGDLSGNPELLAAMRQVVRGFGK